MVQWELREAVGTRVVCGPRQRSVLEFLVVMREALGVSKGFSNSHNGDWWCSEEVQEKA